jgi:hypothetical protein
MSLLSWSWLVLGLVAVVVAHELTHVAIARAYGFRLVCVALNVIGVAVVFEDTPSRRYWLMQTLLPALTTWAFSLVWLFGLFGYIGPAVAVPIPVPPDTVVLGVTLLSLLTSGGDIVACVIEHRRPVWGDARIIRDLGMLRKLPTLVRFTEHGRRWLPVWAQLGAGQPTGIGA